MKSQVNYGLTSAGSGQGPVVGFCEHDTNLRIPFYGGKFFTS
jgi:hypothetical protein